MVKQLCSARLPRRMVGAGSPGVEPGRYGTPGMEPGRYGTPGVEPGRYGTPGMEPGRYGVRHRIRSRANSGMILLEVVMVVAISASLIAFSLKLFVTSNQLFARQEWAMDRMESLRDLDYGFRDSLREQGVILPAWGEYASGDRMLVLHQKGTPDRYTVWGDLLGSGHLARYEFEGSAVGPMLTHAQQYKYPLSEWQFTWDDQSGLVRLRFVTGTEPGERKRPDTEHHIAVAMRGRAL